MAAFNSMPAMSSGGAPGDAMGMNGAGQHLGMDSFDQDMVFDESLIDSSTLPPLPFTPSYDFDNFATTFEDPFSYSTKGFEPPPNNDGFNEESSPQELDNKLLGFSDPVMSATVVDETGNFADVNMSAELYGMFFVAEDVFGGDSSGRPLELTCYRRNLWQCSGQVTLPRVISNVVDDQGRQLQIYELTASISAMESIDGKATEIISIPWKSSNTQVNEEGKVAAAPPNLTLDLGVGQELDANRISVPISWKRLQFKHATANNGRRKGLQQHYVVQISLLGKAKSGEVVKIAEIQSGPVIVRGRSPRNFQDSKKDVAVTAERKPERKNTASSDNATLKTERENLQASAQQRFHNMGNTSQPADWTAATPQPIPQQSPHPAKRVAISPNMARPPIPAWSNDANPVMPKTVAPTGNVPPQPQARGSISRQSAASVPINLSLSEDERSPNRSSVDLQSPQLGKTQPASGGNAAHSPTDEIELLYEYFPLTVDDWMPPVDAVYRPHVVHHTIVPPEVKAQQVQNKAKRYFLAD